MNILFVRLSYIGGDILHATPPAARWIKEQYPDTKLHWIVTPSMVDLLKGNPYVDEIIPWERDVYEAHSKKLHIPTMWRMWWDLKAKLKPYHFDVAVDVQGRLISGLVLLASGAPIRLGLGGTKELNWLFTNYKAKPSKAHVIRRYMDVVQLLPRALADKGIEPVKETGADDKDAIDANALYAMNFRVSLSQKNGRNLYGHRLTEQMRLEMEMYRIRVSTPVSCGYAWYWAHRGPARNGLRRSGIPLLSHCDTERISYVLAVRKKRSSMHLL